jgi:hypothetical protein
MYDILRKHQIFVDVILQIKPLSFVETTTTQHSTITLYRTTGHPTPDTRHPTPNTQHPTPNTQHPTPDTRHPTPDTRHPTPDTRHPTPDTRHPTPTHAHIVRPLEHRTRYRMHGILASPPHDATAATRMHSSSNAAATPRTSLSRYRGSRGTLLCSGRCPPCRRPWTESTPNHHCKKLIWH